MYEKMLTLIYKIERVPALNAVRKGFILIIPLIVTGSLCIMLRSLPIPALQEWLPSFGGGIFLNLLSFIIDSTTGLMSLYLALSISYYYATEFTLHNSTMQILAMFTSLACFAASFGAASGSLTLSSFGTLGVFTALLCSILSTRLYFLIAGLLSKITGNTSFSNDDHYHGSVSAILPIFFCIAVFSLLNWLLNTVLHVQDINQLIANGLVAMFSNINNELVGGLLYTFMLNLLWVFGMHGGNALDGVAQTVFQEGSNTILTKSIMDNFAVIGGSGATICFLIALLVFSKSRRNRSLAYSAAPIAIFNINEILVFGFPIVLNPVLAIPFIIVPIVSMLIAYFAAYLGLMPIVHNAVHWTTPVFFSGYVASGSISGALVQLVIVAVGTAIYAPFVKFAEKIEEKRLDYVLDDLTNEFKKNENSGVPVSYLSRNDSNGILAKSIVSQLKSDIVHDKLPMFFQPVVDEHDGIASAEALLRWRYQGRGIYPPLIIALAREDGCLEDMTWNIITTVCKNIRYAVDQINPDMTMSVNIVADQLDSESFVESLITIAQRFDVCDNLVLEVTEETSLANLRNVSWHINRLHEHGIRISIDDFGMGQTSLDYLRNNSFDYVKLDGSLVKQVVTNPRCREIISSILALGKSLEFHSVAEHVEYREVQELLAGLGCDFFQGYLHSPAIPWHEFVAFCSNKKDAHPLPDELLTR